MENLELIDVNKQFLQFENDEEAREFISRLDAEKNVWLIDRCRMTKDSMTLLKIVPVFVDRF